MKPLACYIAFTCGWLTICLLGVSLGHALPASFVFFPCWLPFAVGGILLTVLSLAALFIVGATWLLSGAVEWKAKRGKWGGTGVYDDLEAKGFRARGMGDSVDPADAWAAIDGIPAGVREFVSSIGCASGRSIVEVRIPHEWTPDVKREMEGAGWRWIAEAFSINGAALTFEHVEQ